MIERFLMKCLFTKNNHGKFLYKCLANNGDPVWATGMDNAMEFELRECAELFAVEKGIVAFDIICVVKCPKVKKQEPESIINLIEQ